MPGGIDRDYGPRAVQPDFSGPGGSEPLSESALPDRKARKDERAAGPVSSPAKERGGAGGRGRFAAHCRHGRQPEDGSPSG